MDLELLARRAGEAVAEGFDALEFDLAVLLQQVRPRDQVTAALVEQDVLVNTAGMIIRKPLVEFTEQEYGAVFAANAKTVFFMMREAARRLADNGRILSSVTTMVGALARCRRASSTPPRATAPSPGWSR